jgi:hypothetical protein
MDIIKEKLKDLVLASNYESVKKIFNDPNFESQSFEKSRNFILDDLEIRLVTNKDRGVVVHGLEEAVSNIRNFNSEAIVTNLVNTENWEAILYTDNLYSLILGVI